MKPKDKLKIKYCTKCGRMNVSDREHFAADRSGVCLGSLKTATYRLEREEETPDFDNKPRNIFARDTPRNY